MYAKLKQTFPGIYFISLNIHCAVCREPMNDANAAPAPARQHHQCSLDKSRGFYADNRPSSVQI